MSAPGDLTILANALTWLGQSDDENDVIQRLITAVSSDIQKFLGYQIASANYTRSFNGIGGRKLMLPDRPITAVSSLTIDDVPVPLSTSAFMDGFLFDDKVIYLRGSYEFCRGVQNIQTTYTAGFASVPGGIEQACLDWVKITYDNLDTLPGITKLKAGDSEIDYGKETGKIGSMTLLMPAIVASRLQPYRRMTPS
jgi:hypothetical protein